MTPRVIACALGFAVAVLTACDRSTSESSLPGDALSALKTRQCKPPAPDREILLPIAPRNKRVDLVTPTFTNPTSVTNPLFPISNLSQVVLVGFVGGAPFRAETTLLPGTQPINVGEQVVQTLTSQYVAYLHRRIDEVASDWYGQADDGSVWYFGEDVFNFEDGKLADTDGTWITCKDGPTAMIMPALPAVGDVYRVEDIYPTVFEEIEVTEIGQTVDGPLGPVSGAFTVRQLGLDGRYTPKTFAPGYGEFSTGDGNDVEALALAVPTDASPLATPAELRALLSGARSVFNAAQSGDWTGASNTVDAMNLAWEGYPAGVTPRLLKPLLAEALANLTAAVTARQPAESRQFAVDVARHGLDFLLQHRSRIDVDFGRLDLFVRQLVFDAEAGDTAGIGSDVVILKLILDRLLFSGDARDQDLARSVRRQLNPIRVAAERGDKAGILAAAARVQQTLSGRVLDLE